MTTLLVLGAISAAAGACLARWEALVIPVLLVGAFYGGLYVGWWGNGLGENWGAFALMVLWVLEVGTAVAIAIARGGAGSRTRRSSDTSS